MGKNDENEEPKKKPPAPARDRVVARKITVADGDKLVVLNAGDVVVGADVEKRMNQGVAFEP